MQYEYDSWNRIQTMTYPDGEVVSYGYNCGGMLKSVSGNKNGVPFRYIDSIAYNKFELKDTVWYGNGTRVAYTYDSLQRLLHLRSYEGHDSLMQDIAYTYDAAGNITDIDNAAGMLPNGLGGAYRNTYKYDDLYRLSEANCSGTIVEMSYHANGRIQRKTVKRPITAQEHERTAYVVTPNEYTYNINQPNTLKGIRPYNYHGSSINQTVEADSRFRWDLCGNMVFHEDVPGNLVRNMVWTEENRLLLVADNSHLSLYLYDAGGERAYKLTGDYHLQNTNGQWFENYTLTTPTLYASPYLVANRQGYTKHYYAGSERVASRIGGGGLADLDWNAAQHRVNGAWDNATGQVRSGHRLLPSLPSDLLAGLFDWQDSVQPETDCYWYHPDHLGSASWVTDADGSAVQHLEYLPWGEDLVDQRSTNWNAMYTFSAKEKDTETGYSYFGSRYYSSDLSVWLSVDPMASKYPSLSPYVYCADNPVKLVDPNGEEIGNPPLHHHFLITIGIQIYEAAKKKGATPNGAILVLAHACRESGWGKTAKKNGDYNLFGIMGKPSKIPTQHGSLKDYSNIGGYEASINDYFNRTDDKWPTWKDVLAQDCFTSDDIDRALNTGSYFPSKDDQKNGIYAYCGDRDANGKSHYGEGLMEQFVSSKKRFIQSLEYQINKNEEMIRQGIPYSTQYLNILEKDNERYNTILNEIR